MKSFEWFVAWRYLFSRERKALVSVITLISMGGVAVGVAALITVIGVMDGADELLFGKIADLYPHIRIVNTKGADEPIDQELLDELRGRNDIIAAEPIIQRIVLMQKTVGNTVENHPAQLIGLDSVGAGSIYTLADTDGDPIVDSRGDPVELGPKEVLMGWPLGHKLGAVPGSIVRITSPNALKTATQTAYKSVDMQVRGWFDTGFYEFDSQTAFVSNDQMRKLFLIQEDKGADYIHIKLRDPFAADRIKNELNIGGMNVTTWSQENGAFFTALKLEKFALFIILLLIILVAAFNIIGTLILIVSEKTREIGILKAVGAPERVIGRIFLLEGVMIGLIGTAAGVALGVILCLLIPKIPFDLPQAVYNFKHLPVKIRPGTILMIVASAMAICTLAGLFPARQAARMNPVEALRHD